VALKPVLGYEENRQNEVESLQEEYKDLMKQRPGSRDANTKKYSVLNDTAWPGAHRDSLVRATPGPVWSAEPGIRGRASDQCAGRQKPVQRPVGVCSMTPAELNAVLQRIATKKASPSVLTAPDAAEFRKQRG